MASVLQHRCGVGQWESSSPVEQMDPQSPRVEESALPRFLQTEPGRHTPQGPHRVPPTPQEINWTWSTGSPWRPLTSRTETSWAEFSCMIPNKCTYLGCELNRFNLSGHRKPLLYHMGTLKHFQDPTHRYPTPKAALLSSAAVRKWRECEHGPGYSTPPFRNVLLSQAPDGNR